RPPWLAARFVPGESVLLLLAIACSPTELPEPPPAAPAEAAQAPAAAPAAPATNPNVAYGAEVDPTGAVPVDQLVAQADTWNGKPVTLTGTVKQVCQKKGCWHTIGTSDPAVDVMVKDKEYKIFLPFDAAGKTAVVKGTFSVETLPLEEARHYAEDAGKDPNTVTVAPKTFLMDADGIKLI
ncbi:MAG: DUF4920 domain-containing protein, partial [Myxococcota bacterium]